MRKYALALLATLVLVSVAYRINMSGAHTQQQAHPPPNLQGLQLR